MAETTQAAARAYSISDIERMRQALRWSYPSGVSYYPKERGAEIEDRLRTYMIAGTSVEELEAWSAERQKADMECQQRQRQFYAEEAAKRPPPPSPPKNKEEVLARWFKHCVAKYEGASVEADDLYRGPGRSLANYAKNIAPDGVHVSQKDMERFLAQQGIKSRNAMFAKRYDGIRHVMHGDVASGNYGT